MPATYERLPTSSTSSKADPKTSSSDTEPDNEPTPTQIVDSRFVRPTPSPWKRAALLLFIVVLFWLAFSMRRTVHMAKQQQVVHAKRYSKDHKFRPAASPVVTQYLKDGRMVLRGAQPTAKAM